MESIKDLSFNLSKVYNRLIDPPVRTRFFQFTSGMLNQLTPREIKAIKDIIEVDFIKANRILDSALPVKHQSKTKKK